MTKLSERDLEFELYENLDEEVQILINGWELEAADEYLEQGYNEHKVNKLVKRVADTYRKSGLPLWHKVRRNQEEGR